MSNISFSFICFSWLTKDVSEGLQKSTAEPGVSALQRIKAIAGTMYREEGAKAFYKGITPRVLRVAPGQAVVFPVYEKVRQIIERMNTGDMGDTYSE